MVHDIDQISKVYLLIVLFECFYSLNENLLLAELFEEFWDIFLIRQAIYLASTSTIVQCCL